MKKITKILLSVASLALFSCEQADISSSSTSNSTQQEEEEEYPTLRELISNLVQTKSYTLNIESYITNLVFNSKKSFTKDECYFESSYFTENFGYKNSDEGFYKFRIKENQFKPSYVLDENVKDYHEAYEELSSLNELQFPDSTFKDRDNVYNVKNSIALRRFALLSDLVQASELTTYVPTALEVKVTGKDSFYGDLTFAASGIILGKVRYVVSSIGSTDISAASSYQGEALPFTGEIEKISKLFSSHNFTSQTLDSKNSVVSDNYYVENAIYQDFSTAYESKEDSTYVDEGIVKIEGKTSVEDGYYRFEYKDNEVTLGEKYDLSISSLYDLATFPGFLGNVEVLKTFDEESETFKGYYDFFTSNQTLLDAIGQLTNIYTQQEYSFYVLGAGLSLEDASLDKDCVITLSVFFSYQGKYSYQNFSYKNFGNVKLDFLDAYLNNLD